MLLALMPQSPCFPLQTTAPMATGTMSLAILPSAPMTFRPSPAASTPTPSSLSTTGAPSPSKRPKLSLNTANAPTTVFGKGSTSLRLETLSATSPTTRNTFRNAYSQSQPQQQRPNLRSPRSPRSPRLRISPLVTSMNPSSTSSGSPTSAPIDTPSPNDSTSTPPLSSSSSSASSASTSATPTATTPDSTSTTLPPYKVAFNIISILTNSPLAPASPSNSRKRAWSQSKPIFPAMKKVAFRTPLTEDIHTDKYTYRHSDLESPSSSTISTLELSPPEEMTTSVPSDAMVSAENIDEEAVPTSLMSSPRTGDKRESSDEEDDDEDSDDPVAASRSCPATPIAGRRKRHRQWVWTLGPIEPSEAHLTASQESHSS